MNDLTVVILTKNEELNIVEVVKNARLLTNKVLIVDSGSTDKTVELAKENGALIVYREWDNDFSAQRNFALEHVDTEWLLYLDADERFNKELCCEIRKVVKGNKNIQCSIKRKSIAFGKEFNYGVLSPDYVPRLFKTSHVKWENKVHERPVCNDKIIVLDGYIQHYTYTSWEQWLRKFNQYTSIWAKDAFEKGKRVKIIDAFGHSIAGFIKMAFIKRGVFDGSLGIVMCLNHFFYTLTKYLKLIELQRMDGKTDESCHIRNCKN